jgi:hypothetical protein
MIKKIMKIFLILNPLILFAAQPAEPTILVKAVVTRVPFNQKGFKRHCFIRASMKVGDKDLFVHQFHNVNRRKSEERFKETRHQDFNSEKHYAELQPYYAKLVKSINLAEADALKHDVSSTCYYENHPLGGFIMLGSDGLAASSPKAKG